MLGHLSFGVADLARAIAFYDAALAPLGYVRVWTSEKQAGYGVPGGGDKLALKLQPGPVVPPGPGFHLALTAPSPKRWIASMRRRWRPAAPTRAGRARAHTMARPTTRPSCAIRMGTSSKRSSSN